MLSRLLLLSLLLSHAASSSLAKRRLRVARPAPREEDPSAEGDESHDEAYNSIISQYYTTDPFFGTLIEGEGDPDEAGGEDLGGEVARLAEEARRHKDKEDKERKAR